MAFNANGMSGGVPTDNNVSELEEILNLQRQGRQLSAMQLRSLDACMQRSLANGSNASSQLQLSQQMPGQMMHQIPPQQQQAIPGMNMHFQGQSPFHNPTFADSLRSGYATGNDPMTNQHSAFPSETRRRSSMALFNNFVAEMGFGNNSSTDGLGIGNIERRRTMDRRTSLDLLGDAALAVSNQEQITNIDTAATGNYMNSSIGHRSSLDLLMNGDQNRANLDFLISEDQKRASLDALTNTDPSLGRRNSLSQLLAQDYTNSSRRSSMATGSFGNPIDPYYMENLFDDQAKFAAAGLALQNGHSAATNGSDILTLQLLQQQKAEEENALSNVEDYIKLQKLQTSLRRQSLSHMYDEMAIMQTLQNNNSSMPQHSELPSDTQTPLEQVFQHQIQEQQLQLQQHLQQQQQEHQEQQQQQQQRQQQQEQEQEQQQEIHEKQQLQQQVEQQQLEHHLQQQEQLNQQQIQKEPEPEEEELPPLKVEQIDSFQKSMDTSAKSQKDIQLWDKKMGLKRSHSATMTKTTRSRKNLRKVLERHMSIISENDKETGTKDEDGNKNEKIDTDVEADVDTNSSKEIDL